MEGLALGGDLHQLLPQGLGLLTIDQNAIDARATSTTGDLTATDQTLLQWLDALGLQPLQQRLSDGKGGLDQRPVAARAH